MANLNKAMLIGRLGQDPEKRATATGRSIVKVSLATSDFYTDKMGEKHEKTEWHRLVFWDRLADLVAQYCRKGSLIYVEGQIRTNEWRDKDDIRRFTTEVHANIMQFLDSRSRGDAPQASAGRSSDDLAKESPAEKPSSDPAEDEYTEDDIPF